MKSIFCLSLALSTASGKETAEDPNDTPVPDSLQSGTQDKESGSSGSDSGSEVLVLEDLVVKGYKTVLDENLTEEVVIASDVKKLPLIDNDIFRAVQAHPGVSSDEFSAGFSVRGGDRDETLVVLDGMELFSPFHLQDYGNALSVLDMLAVSKARLYLGGYPAEFGDRMSAVLDVKTRDPSEKPAVDAGIDLLNAHLFVTSSPVFASVRAGYIGLLMGLYEAEEKFTPHYGDALLRLDYAPSQKEKLSGYFLYAGDLNSMDKPGRGDDVESEFHNGMLWARYDRDLSGKLRLTAFPYGGMYLQERRTGVNDRDDRDLSHAGLKSILSYDIHRNYRLKGGVDMRWMQGIYDYYAADSNITIDTEHQDYAVKGFLLNTLNILPALTMDLGARLLVHFTDSRTEIAPSAALSLTPVKELSFRAAWGIYYQPVDALHLPVEAGIDSTMPSERSMHWTGGGQYHNSSMRLNLRTEIYYKRYDRLAGFMRDFGRTSHIYWPHDEGFAWGVEGIVDKGLGPALLHLGYTYSVSKVSNGDQEFYSDNDRRHAVDAGLSLEPGKNWSIYLGFTFYSGQPYTRYDSVSGPYPREPNTERLPPYHILSTRISKEWSPGKTKIQAYLQVFNLYGMQNVHEYVFTESESGEFTRETEYYLFQIPIPTLGVNMSF
jgi:hypothetical protein